MAIVTISRQLGSLGDEIALKLADALGVNSTDKTTLEETLRRHGFPERKIEHFDEKRPPFWETLSSDTRTYLHFLKTVILEFTASGGGVVLGRGGSCVLSDVPGILHVRIVAPTSVRVARVREREQLDDSRARKIVHQSDSERAGFHRYFFGVDWNAPELYTLTINTAILTADETIEIITATLDSSAFAAARDSARSRIADLRLANAVETAIVYEARMPVRYFEAHARDGVVRISGTVPAEESIQRCEELARTVPGVESVVQEIRFVPEYTSVMQ